ncbi:type 1 fimbrial protein [Leclercia adecarboxylata]|uniref:fimbrial protein n=1 Tax=Leclercia adecarboxylata TaxID=83655 RepID=UPI00202A79B8|nr:fimbrial protein [Leclercia adecarboxylata]URO01168.1 type 1 fimbrial protein [Leclercia adecarboxylata]
MKKTILAIFVAATAVVALPAMAAGNTANLVIHGEVFDDSESCNVTQAGALVNNTIILDDIKADVLEGLAVNTPSLAAAKDVVYKVEDCKTGGANYSGNLNVNISGEALSDMPNVLLNQIASGAAQNASVTLINRDNSRINFDGSHSQTVAYQYGTPTYLRYKATYVRTAANVTPGEVKGTAVMTISY